MSAADRYVEAWKRTLDAMDETIKKKDAKIVLSTIEELRIMYGDPREPMPIGTMTADGS